MLLRLNLISSGINLCELFRMVATSVCRSLYPIAYSIKAHKATTLLTLITCFVLLLFFFYYTPICSTHIRQLISTHVTYVTGDICVSARINIVFSGLLRDLRIDCWMNNDTGWNQSSLLSLDRSGPPQNLWAGNPQELEKGNVMKKGLLDNPLPYFLFSTTGLIEVLSNNGQQEQLN